MFYLTQIWLYTCILWPPLFLFAFSKMIEKQRRESKWVVELVVASISLFMILVPLYAAAIR